MTIRQIATPLFRRFNPGDICIRHHWTAQPFHLHSFRHRGYWWHGKNRERETIETLSRMILPGDRVWDVGANIGYLTQCFEHQRALVTAFEPASDNIRYLTQNISATTRLIDAAVGSEEAVGVPLYTESLTGQNCSMLPDYSVFVANARFSGYKTDASVEHVRVITLDRHMARSGERPALIKIDIEGFEFEALLGMREVLASARPNVIIEVTRKHQEVFDFMQSTGYRQTVTSDMNTFWEPFSR
jgi:FkbM family methyltransferase